MVFNDCEILLNFCLVDNWHDKLCIVLDGKSEIFCCLIEDDWEEKFLFGNRKSCI